MQCTSCHVNNKPWPLHNDKASVPDIFYIQIQHHMINFIVKLAVLQSKINCVNGKAPSTSKISLEKGPGHSTTTKNPSHIFFIS